MPTYLLDRLKSFCRRYYRVVGCAYELVGHAGVLPAYPRDQKTNIALDFFNYFKTIGI